MTQSGPTGGGRSWGRAVRVAATLVAAGGLAAACSGAGITSQPLPLSASATTVPSTAATTARAAAAPPGFTGFTSDADRFSLSVPSDWRQVDPASPGAARAMEELARSNEKLAPLLTMDLAAQGIKFLAVDQDGNSVNVVVKPALGALPSDLPDLVDEIKAQYESLGATLRSNETVRVGGHEALRLTLDVQLTGPDGRKVTLGEVQYFLVANDLVYIVTMAGDSPEFPAIISTFTVN